MSTDELFKAANNELNKGNLEEAKNIIKRHAHNPNAQDSSGATLLHLIASQKIVMLKLHNY